MLQKYDIRLVRKRWPNIICSAQRSVLMVDWVCINSQPMNQSIKVTYMHVVKSCVILFIFVAAIDLVYEKNLL